MIFAAIRKDCWLLLRDRGALLSLFALPIVFILTFGMMFSGGGGSSKGPPITSFHAPDSTPCAAGQLHLDLGG